VNRLAAAHAEFIAALREERAEIERMLQVLESAVPKPKPPPHRARRVSARPRKKKGLTPQESGRLGGLAKARAKSRRASGKLAAVAGEKSDAACDGCGLEGIGKSRGPGGYMAMHRAPCGLVCAASNIDRLDPEERTEGVHSRKNCPRCNKAASKTA